jgi:hypothetical protein
VAIGINGCATSTEEWLAVNGGQLQEEARHRDLLARILADNVPQLGYEQKEFVVTGHRIVPGAGAVFAFRSFDPGPILGVDRAGFLKLTGFVPQSLMKVGGEIRIPATNGPFVFLSTSSSNFPGASGCYGYASSGFIRIDSIASEALTATMDLQFRLFSPLGHAQECRDAKNMRGTYKMPLQRVEQLTPWQGREGKSLYDETMKP